MASDSTGAASPAGRLAAEEDDAPTECRACYGKGWNDEWRRVPGHYLGGEEARIHCDECGGTGEAKKEGN